MEILLLYFWLKLDLVILLCIYAAVFIGVALPIITGMLQIYDSWEDFRPVIILQIKIALIFLVFSILLPSKTDIAILVGASYAVDLAKSPEGLKVQSLIRQKVNDVLDEQLNVKVKNAK